MVPLESFKMSEKEIRIVDDWIHYYPKLCLLPEFQITDRFYFDERPCLIFQIPLIGKLFVHLPIRTGRKNSCTWNSWGFHFDCCDKLPTELVIHRGKKSGKYIKIPFIHSDLLSREYLLKDGEYHTKKRFEFGSGKWRDQEKYFDDNLHIDTIDCEYKLSDGTIQKTKAKVNVNRQTWYRHWLKWLPWTHQVEYSIDVTFADEIGEQAGSYKGGTVGCYESMKPGERVDDAVHRMMLERKF